MDKFEEFLRYKPGVMALLRRLNFSEEDAEDIAQDAYLRVYQHMKDYRGESRWTYLEQTVRRLAYNRIRDAHTQKRSATLVALEDAADRPSAEEAPDVVVEKKRKNERLRAAIGQLDQKYRSCVLLDLAGYSNLEIARNQGLTEQTVKSRLHAARARLRELLGEDPGLGGER